MKKTVQNKRITAIVPFYNEEKTLACVLESLLKNPLIHEIICINDGSTDDSLTVVKTFQKRVLLINFRKNHGKGYALATGIKKATGDIVLFIDADIKNLKPSHIKTLLKPFDANGIKTVLGYPPPKHYFARLFLPLTGERAYYKKDLLPHIKKMAKTGYGVETYLNALFPQEEIAIVPLRGLQLLEKREKYGLRKSFRGEMRALVQISLEMAKQEGLLPRDYAAIKTLAKATNLPEAKELFQKITNKRVRRITKRVFLEIMDTKYFSSKSRPKR